MKTTLKSLKLSQIGRNGQYYKENTEEDEELIEKDLNILRGFKVNLVQLNSGLYLQVDVCSRVLQEKNLL